MVQQSKTKKNPIDKAINVHKPMVWGETDVGRERERNEDAIFPQSDGRGYKYTPKAETVHRKGYLLIVADGIGGAQAGNEASQWAIRRAVENYYEQPGDNLGEDLRAAILHANTSLYQYMQSTNTPDAGCTMSAAIIHNNTLYVANVGDSRVYLIRNAQIFQLTRDHTLTQQKIDQGMIDPEMAKTDASRSILTRSLGALPDVQVDLFSPTPLEPGDQVLLCSDGLYDMLDNQEIARFVKGRNLQKAVQHLILSANRRGGYDNISVIIARIPGTPLTTKNQSQSIHIKLSTLVSSLARWQRVTIFILMLSTLVVFSLMGWTVGRSLINRTQALETVLTATKTQEIVVNPPLNAQSTATPSPTLQEVSTGKSTSTPQPTAQYTTPTPEITATPKPQLTETQDKDGDQITDVLDDCPDEAGSPEFSGCPDTDGDGVPDPDDECPTEGIASKPEDQEKPLKQGCLDTDEDGFPNISDLCPEIWAANDTDGCPPVDDEGSDNEKCPSDTPECNRNLVRFNGEWKCVIENPSTIQFLNNDQLKGITNYQI